MHEIAAVAGAEPLQRGRFLGRRELSEQQECRGRRPCREPPQNRASR
jgi:hypothetical protein